MNYNDWFYQQHRYLKGNREGIETYNDTKWVDINKRYQTLIDMKSKLLKEQPFNVVGNDKGFDKLIDLMAKSNYSFEDIDESLITSYQSSGAAYKNVMSRMVVNTHAVMCKYNYLDKEHVANERFTHYYIIDAPFNQLHFGDRDEFIRHKLHMMHNTAFGNYVPMETFNTSEVSDILGFTLLCTVNGFICNDCQVAIDDKGFKFKIGWLYSADVDFVIYKLDESVVYKCSIPAQYIINKQIIPFKILNNINQKIDVNNQNCLINIYDPDFLKTVPSVPNFGTFNDEGLVISNIQSKTIDDLKRNASDNVNIVIYGIKYFHEIPNVYPAINYYDIMDSRRVMTDNELNVKNVDGKQIVATASDNINELEVETPPIIIDRPINISFKTILNCLDLYENMMKFDKTFRDIGALLINFDLNQTTLFNKIIKPIRKTYDELKMYYAQYLEGAILTSLVPSNLIDKFETFIESLNKFKNIEKVDDLQKYTINEFYSSNYQKFVKQITAPFRDNALSNLNDLSDICDNYFVNDNHNRFNRPISEQCFITLRYNRDEKCWVFDLPNIQHFKGIGNSFYINDGLNGDEIFKFFVLYTDTDAPSVKEIDDLSESNILDFDLFCNEVNRHMGFIRYWNAENKLLKLSKIMYNKYDGETCVQVLSKILKRKIDSPDLIDIYPSDINYELSNVTSDNIDGALEDERAPFALNFLFYTLSMLHGNEDKLHAYFYRELTDSKYNNRYSDIDISRLLENEYGVPINYSQFSILPLNINKSSSQVASGFSAYYGIPFVMNGLNIVTQNPHPFVFNVYDENTCHYKIIDNDITDGSYVKCNGKVVSCYDDINMAKLITKYLSYCYDYISDLQTDYQKSYNISTVIESALETITRQINIIRDESKDKKYVFQFTSDIVETIITDNDMIEKLKNLQSYVNIICHCKFGGRNISNVDFFNRILSALKRVYVTTGFDNYAAKRIRKFYLYLKKINNKMNIYEYRKWLNEFDIDLLNLLDSLLAKNENFADLHISFNPFAKCFNEYRDNVQESLDLLYNNIKTKNLGLSFTDIIEYCEDVYENGIFEMYILNEISFNQSAKYTSKPYLVTCTLSHDNHVIPNIPNIDYGGTSFDYIFKPIVEKTNNGYVIKSITKICEYAFFNDTTISAVMSVLDSNGNTINTMNVELSFKCIGSNADKTNTFNQIANIKSTTFDFENVHETYDVDSKGMIISKKTSDMNYEMLFGNHFNPLDHYQEYILDRKTLLQGSVDRVFVENQKINNLANEEYGHHVNVRMFFKPSQVIHLTNVNGEIDSVGGKYFVGQHVYLATHDNKCVFPVIITAIDHSKERGFIEAIIDDHNTSWFTDLDIHHYLNDDIECYVIDDNISNFLNEFVNTTYHQYNVVEYDFDQMKDVYTLPGDPLFISNNTDFVYTRLNWMFGDLIPNRFLDDYVTHKFTYLGAGSISDSDPLTIKMINLNLNNLSDPELYPILRDEPNDHEVWDKEVQVFNSCREESKKHLKELREQLEELENKYDQTQGYYDRQILYGSIESLKLKISSTEEFQKKLDIMIEQLEPATTWFNVHAYEDTLVYMANGRAPISPYHVSNITDIPYNSNLNIFLYDWENKHWLSPDTYSVTRNIVSGVKIDEHDDYKTKNVISSITITPGLNFESSNKVLVYLAYDTSEGFETITPRDICNVRFKPILSLNNKINDYSPYSNIRIRKHFDGHESFHFNSYETPDDISIDKGFYIHRPKRNGVTKYSPNFRMCDIRVKNGENIFEYNQFDLYVRLPVPDVTTTRKFKMPSYTTEINQPIDSFVAGQKIKLICIQNNAKVSYDGNISSVMFEGMTCYDDNDNPSIQITNASTDMVGSYICTVFRDINYKPCGGIITVSISASEESLVNGNWIKIPNQLSLYKEIPEECVLVPHENIGLDMTDKVIITFQNIYVKQSDDSIDSKNTNVYNPFEYYYDAKKEHRLPISNVRLNNPEERLVIDNTLNPDINLIKSSYIGICRYSLQQIPKDGKIDMTGFIPTPLSRNRFEFWVNGRNITDPNDLKILSPTSIQLCNLKSLRNFELIELVDDVNKSLITPQGNVYVDLNGKVFSSYQSALISNHHITNQNIRYMFNISQHKSIHDYTSDIISNPRNQNIEEDILDSIVFEQSNDYNSMYNLPSLNGITIYHPSTNSLGMMDTPNENLITSFDKAWRYEMLTNPLFMGTHRDGLKTWNNQGLRLHVNYTPQGYMIHSTGTSFDYYTLYISRHADDNISDVENTLKIIPFIKTGIKVLIDESYKGMWLHSTDLNCKAVKII